MRTRGCAQAPGWEGKGEKFMSDSAMQPSAESMQTDSGLTQWQRVSNTFFAPSKTFDDISRGHRSWWLPFLITILFTYLVFGAVTMKVGWRQVAETNMAASPRQADRMSQLTPAQRERAMGIAAVVTEVVAAASPVMVLIGACLVSLLLWGTMNFVFGGKSTFAEIFVVDMYAMLPHIIPPILGAVALFAGMAPESFNLNNMAATNVAYFFSFQDTNKALYAFLSQLDFVNLWVAILLSIGIAKVAGKKKSVGFITVFGWWGAWTLIRVALGFVAG